MTVRFNCPECNELIAFPDKDIGKRGRCFNCGQRFIIPSEDWQVPKKLLSEEELEALKPVPGFFSNALVNWWKLFSNPENLAGFVFVAAAVTFKFFIGHIDYSTNVEAVRVQAPVGQIVTVCAWGCLFWYYMEVIRSEAFEEDELPEVYLGGIFGFIWKVVKSVFAFAVVLIVVELPCIIYLMVAGPTGLYSRTVALILVIFGLFFFPVALMTYTVSEEFWMIFRPDYLYKPIRGAFFPYITIVILFVTAWEMQLNLSGYGDVASKEGLVVGLHLLSNIGVQVLALITMRAIGLFYRHYRCYLPW